MKKSRGEDDRTVIRLRKYVKIMENKLNVVRSTQKRNSLLEDW